MGGSSKGEGALPDDGAPWVPEDLFQTGGKIVSFKSGRMATRSPGGLLRFTPRSMAERSNTWRLTSAVYEPLWRRFSSGMLTRGEWTLERECQIMLSMLQPVSGGKYLDVGCSTGVYARAIMSGTPGTGVILVDYSLPMLQKARHKTEEYRESRAAYLRCDAAAMPLADKCMDGAVMGGTLNELAEPERVLSEMVRVLKPGATAVVMHLVRSVPTGLTAKFLASTLAPGGVWIPDETGADAMFREAGLVVKESRVAGAMRLACLQKPA